MHATVAVLDPWLMAADRETLRRLEDSALQKAEEAAEHRRDGLSGGGHETGGPEGGGVQLAPPLKPQLPVVRLPVHNLLHVAHRLR